MPVMPVVPDPSPAFKVGDAGRVERPEPTGLPGRPAGVTSVLSPGTPEVGRILARQAVLAVMPTEPSGQPCRGCIHAIGNRLDAHSPLIAIYPPRLLPGGYACRSCGSAAALRLSASRQRNQGDAPGCNPFLRHFTVGIRFRACPATGLPVAAGYSPRRPRPASPGSPRSPVRTHPPGAAGVEDPGVQPQKGELCTPDYSRTVSLAPPESGGSPKGAGLGPHGAVILFLVDSSGRRRLAEGRWSRAQRRGPRPSRSVRSTLWFPRWMSTRCWTRWI